VLNFTSELRVFLDNKNIVFSRFVNEAWSFNFTVLTPKNTVFQTIMKDDVVIFHAGYFTALRASNF